VMGRSLHPRRFVSGGGGFGRCNLLLQIADLRAKLRNCSSSICCGITLLRTLRGRGQRFCSSGEQWRRILQRMNACKRLREAAANGAVRQKGGGRDRVGAARSPRIQQL
jgi:hypothetical protein